MHIGQRSARRSPNIPSFQKIIARLSVLPVAARVFFVFGLLLLLTGSMTAVAMLRINTIKAAEEKMVNAIGESLALQEIETAYYQGLEAVAAYIGMQEGEALQEIDAAEKDWNAAIERLGSRALEDEGRANHDRLKSLLGQASSVFRQGVALAQAGDYAAARAYHAENIAPVAAEIETLFDETIRPGILADTQAAEEVSGNATTASTRWILSLGAAAVLIGIASGIGITHNITNPIRRLTHAAQKISSGDLDATIASTSKDDLGLLTNVFNQMVSNLRETLHSEQAQRDSLQATITRYMETMTEVANGNLAVQISFAEDGQDPNDPLVLLGRNLNDVIASLRQMITQVRGAVNQLSTASTEIMSATTQQVTGANEQSAAISETVFTVDEVKKIAQQTAGQATEVTGAARQTVAVSHSGVQAVEEIIASMQQIKERVASIAGNILALSEQTQQVGKIVAMINDIAEQSNMLALNAAIEAARAGEHGQGFAVVASEVRSLAEQSRRATQQVSEILSDIQKAARNTVMATEEGTRGVDQGFQLVEQARLAIDQLAGAIEQSAQKAEQMAAGGQQQVNWIDQVAFAMDSINQATLQTLASTRQAEKTAKGLGEVAHALSTIVVQYQV